MAIFDTTCGKRPMRVEHYPSKLERNSSGLIEFENKSDAIESLILIKPPSYFHQDHQVSIHFKVCFSSASFPAA